MMPGTQYKEIRTAIVESFDRSELIEMLRAEMDVVLDNIVVSGRYEAMVGDLVKWAGRTGRVLELIRAAYFVNSSNDALRSVYQDFGLAPAVDLQRGGLTMAPLQPATAPGLEKMIKDYLPVVDAALWRDQMAGQERRVCRIELNDRGNTMGTGFLVGPDAVLTNYHVLESVLAEPALASAVCFRFDYKTLADGTEYEGVVARPHPTEWQLDHSPYGKGEAKGAPDSPPPAPDELDYALVRLDPPIRPPTAQPPAPQGTPRGWVRVPEVDPAITDKSLFILQHPRGAALKLALDTHADPRLVNGGLRLRYATTTDEGSSGSPCFSSRWTLLALHHYGDPAWGRAAYYQGIPIGRIRDRVRAELKRSGKLDVLGDDPP